jgi:hypothetical protein
MAIIKCDEELPPVEDPSGDGVGDEVTVEPYVEQDEVSIGKTLLAVESTCFSPSTPFVDVLPEVRNSDISDTFRADAGLYWYLSDEQKMIHLDEGYISMVESEVVSSNIGKIGMSKTQSKIDIIGHNSYFTSTEQWDAIVDGTDDSRPSPLIPAGSSFEDHAFEMNTPFSKKELEMFANIANNVSVADVESDYDFFDKEYEERIASTIVPENALPHLYTEVQRGDSNDENTTELPEGYFRQWLNDIISDQDEMNEIAQRYENVALLDSVVSETNDTTSAFEILMSYANRENLFPMNMNIEVDTNDISKVMSEAEDVGMVDDIVRMLMGEGNIELAVVEEEDMFVDEPETILTEEVLEGGYNMVADSMAKVLENPAVTAYVSDTVVAQVNSMIAAVKDGSWTTDMAQDIQNKFAGANSNGGFSPVDMEEISEVMQGLTDLIDSDSLMNNIVQSSEIMNNVAEVNNMATNMTTNMTTNTANVVKKYV